jgi:uncharacterized membrane protein
MKILSEKNVSKKIIENKHNSRFWCRMRPTGILVLLFLLLMYESKWYPKNPNHSNNNNRSGDCSFGIQAYTTTTTTTLTPTSVKRTTTSFFVSYHSNNKLNRHCYYNNHDVSSTLLSRRQYHVTRTTTALSQGLDQNTNDRSDNDTKNDPDPTLLISSQSDIIQQIVFLGSFVLLGIGTNVCIHLWQDVAMPLLGIDFYQQIRTILFPITFGIIFMVVGITHFIFDTNFIRIVPPYGTWGNLWQVPTPGRQQYFPTMTYEQYHCYWTGIVEFLGGLWLLYAATIPNAITTIKIPAMILFVLTIGVTPANLYMFTHNAQPGGIIPKLQYPYGHLIRFIIQCGLLSNFWIIANAPSS